MTNWADIVITRIRFNLRRTHLEAVMLHRGAPEAPSAKVERQAVVAEIKSGRSAVTATYRNGSWERGATIEVVRVGNEEYLRTDRNSTSADNLGSLPEF